VLDRMQQILEGIECATSASSLAIQVFVGQGELIIVIDFVEIFRVW
jgi:hypothetical protein